MIHFVVWKWKQRGFRETYTAGHVNIVANMIRNNMQGAAAYRIICVTDEEYGIDPPVAIHPLWKDYEDLPNSTGMQLPSCYRRLKLFDVATQQEMGIKKGDRIISLDLDSIIMRPMLEVINKIDDSKKAFAGWGVRGTYHIRVFNGSFWSIIGGDKLQHIWSTFNPNVSPRFALSRGYLGSDQGWLSLHFGDSKDAFAVQYPDFASYPREVRKTGVLDRRTKIVFFHGSRKPWHVGETNAQPWIRQLWRV